MQSYAEPTMGKDVMEGIGDMFEAAMGIVEEYEKARGMESTSN